MPDSPATTTGTDRDSSVAAERADLLSALAKQRFFLRYPARDLTEEQIRQRSSASELCVGGIIKHATYGERQWGGFIRHGASALGAADDEQAIQRWQESFQVTDEDTLTDLLAENEKAAEETDALVTSLPDLDAAHLLPEAPWFEPGASWSVRRALLHLLCEITQHSGHADVIRESIDGAKSMG